MDTKHTPGPWMESSFEVWSPLNGKRFGKVVANLRRAEAPDDEARANARLIAAAPELLAVLNEARDLIWRQGLRPIPTTKGNMDMAMAYANEQGLLLKSIDAAIAKATTPDTYAH